MPDETPLKAKPFAEQAAANRHDMVAANLFDLLGASIQPWPEDLEKVFGCAADRAIMAADYSDAAMGIVRVTPGLEEHMLPLVKAVDQVLRRFAIPCILIRDDSSDYTPIGDLVAEALSDALRELS